MSKSQEISVWSDINDIKRLFAPTLDEKEFQVFMQLGKSLGANPFTREIYAVKYKGAPASIFCGRDFYRRKAQELPEYDGHTVDAVYSNDVFKVQNSEPQHSYNLSDRGKIVGAYCTVYRKNARVPYYVFVEFKEYNTGKSVWSAKPATMIKKVAEAQGLRGAFQGTFAGTYDESEQWEDNSKNEAKQVKKEPKAVQEAVVVKEEPKMATVKQKTELLLLLNNKVISEEERSKMNESINKMDEERAHKAIDKLKKTIEERQAVATDFKVQLQELRDRAYKLNMSDIVSAIDYRLENEDEESKIIEFIENVKDAIKEKEAIHA